MNPTVYPMSRCLVCGCGKYDILFKTDLLTIEKITCASEQCTGEQFFDCPSGLTCG